MKWRVAARFVFRPFAPILWNITSHTFDPQSYPQKRGAIPDRKINQAKLEKKIFKIMLDYKKYNIFNML